jgi:hypothetical protein
VWFPAADRENAIASGLISPSSVAAAASTNPFDTSDPFADITPARDMLSAYEPAADSDVIF